MKTTNRISLFLGMTTAITASFAMMNVSAMPPGMMGGPSLEMFDKDKNGSVSEQEFNETRAERMAKMAEMGRPMRNAGKGPTFAQLDTDTDGQLNKDELAGAYRFMMENRRSEMMSRMRAPDGGGLRQAMGFKTMDADGNGSISEKELNEARAARMEKMAKMGRQLRNAGNAPAFADIDKDGNGEISMQEMAETRNAMWEKRRTERMKAMSEKGPGMGRGMGPGSGPCMGGMKKGMNRPMRGQGMKMPRYGFKDVDLDGDGMISPEEFAKHHEGMK